MSQRYKGGVISATPPATATSYGVWTIAQQMQAVAANVWPTRPGAPTIGTATAGNATASVTFTAPSNTGYPTSLTYTVTSSPGSLTGTGASSPITVSGLSNGTSYTFSVTATNGAGTGPASAASNSVTPVAPPAWIARYYSTGGDNIRATGVYVDSSSNIFIGADSYFAAYSSTGSLTAQRNFGGAYMWYEPMGNRVFRDSSNNIYLLAAGTSGVPNQWGPVKLNSSYVQQWFVMTRASSSQNYGYPAAINVDASGNVYTSGTLGKDTCCTSIQYPTIVKHNSSGSVQWTTAFHVSNSNANAVYGHVLDSSNNPVVGLTIRAGSPSNKLVAAVAKFNGSTGAFTWQRYFYTPLTQASLGTVAIDSSDNVYLSFWATGNATEQGIYVVKYNSSGTYQWQQTTSGGTYSYYYPVASVVDSSGNLYVASYTYIGSSQYVAGLFKYNSSGTLQWQRFITSTSSVYLMSMAVNNADSAVVLTFTNGTSSYSIITMKYPQDGSKTGTYTVAGASVSISTGNTSSSSPGYGSSFTGAMTTGATGTSTTTGSLVAATSPVQSSAVTNL
jgi:hypothetical protein